MLREVGYLPTEWLLIALAAVMGSLAFMAGRNRAVTLAANVTDPSDTRQLRVGTPNLNQPNYHGYFAAMAALAPALVILFAYLAFGETIARQLLRAELPSSFAPMGENAIAQYIDRAVEASALRTVPPGGDAIFTAITHRFGELHGAVKAGFLTAALAASVAGLAWSHSRLTLEFRARHAVERGIQGILFLCAAIAIATTVGIVVSLFAESLRFFAQIPVFSFLFGTEWNAQTNADFGAIPLFFGTFMIALIAMCVATPIGLFAAIYLSEYASNRARSVAKPVLEVLAGIPTVVYGFFALLVVAPAVRSAAVWINGLPFVPDEFLAASASNGLAAGLVMGVMIIPFVSSLSDDVVRAVPQSLRDAALAMGATQSETIKQVVLPAALPGVIAAILLAVSRAIGETMIVVMAAGQRPAITLDPTSEITTITVQIVALLTGDSAFDSPKTLSAFALGFVLFSVTLVFNLIAIRVVQRFREKYD